MNIEKAIEILDAIVKTGEYEGDPDDSNAVKLGIEALKRVQEDEYRGTEVPREPLPGETQN